MGSTDLTLYLFADWRSSPPAPSRRHSRDTGMAQQGYSYRI